jgi:hypothetical protein
LKYLGKIIRSDLKWADHVNYTLRKAWKAFHFTMHIFKKGNNNTKRLAYTALMRPILEHGAVCWEPYKESQVSTLNRVKFLGMKVTCAVHKDDLTCIVRVLDYIVTISFGYILYCVCFNLFCNV